jgi:hypothetical protein
MKRQQFFSGSVPAIHRMTLDENVIALRLRKRLSLFEAASLGLGFAVLCIAIWEHVSDLGGLIDFKYYINFARGDAYNFFYAYWLKPIFIVLSKLPFYPAYFLWGVISLFGVLFAARVFGANSAMVLFSYQLLYSLYYGQITGVLAGGLGLLWWGMAKRSWWLAGLGLAIAGVKFQSGLLFAGLLILYADISWKDRLKLLILPGLICAASLIAYPFWPMELLATMRINPANAEGSISIWRWIGPWSLLFFLPPIFLKLPKDWRFLMMIAAVPIGLPYFQQADLLDLFILPIGWLPVLAGNLGLNFLFFGYQALQVLFIIPLVLYLWAGLQSLPKFSRVNINLSGDPEKPA